MLVLTDTGDLEPELDISKKAVQSVGLRGKRFVQENREIFRDKGVITSQTANSNKEKKICAGKPICW